MVNFPRCKNCGAEMVLLADDPESWQFGCHPCKFAHVFSKPRAREAARYRVAVERRAERELLRQRFESRPKYFLMPRSQHV